MIKLLKWIKGLFSTPNIILIKGAKTDNDSQFPHDFAQLNARMKAARVQIEDHVKALEVRREWMTIVGFSVEKIEEACQYGNGAVLAEELIALDSANKLGNSNDKSK